MNELNFVQILAIAAFSFWAIASFIRGTIKRGRVSLATFLTTIVPLATFLLIVIGLDLAFDVISLVEIHTLGIVLMVMAFALNSWAMSHLGYLNSDDFWIGRREKKNRYLVTSGPYKHIRHPTALSMILSYVGLLLIFFHPLPLALVTVGITFIIFTSYKEEEFMRNQFPEYETYEKKTGRFLPKLF